MYLKWKERLAVQTEYREINNWPYVAPYVLPVEKRAQYIRNRKIVAKALLGDSLKSISKQFNLSKSTITYLLERALGGDDKEDPELTSALIPRGFKRKSLRKTPLSDFRAPSGDRGSFKLLLSTVPGLNNKLEHMLKSFVQAKPYSQNLTPQIFHKEFLRLLKEANWSTSQYPFNKDKLAYETCRKHFHSRITELKIKPKKNNRTLLTRHTPEIAYEEIQIDAQITDLSSSINIEINGVFHSLRLSRLCLYLVKDVATDCNLAYHLCYSKDPNQSDVLAALRDIHKKWKPLNLKTPGLIYTDGACLPSALFCNPEHIALNMVRMDNALCHFAHSVRSYICNKLNATLNFGLPAQPKGRGYVEHGIKLIAQQTHRFASTTGSKPNSPIKESKQNLKKTPLITLDALEEVLSVLITHHNTIPQSRLGGKSPIQLLKEHVAQTFLTCSLGAEDIELNPHICQKLVSVKLLKNEVRRPHINFAGVRYTGQCLSAKEVLGKKVIIEYDETDIRYLKVLSQNGKHVGKIFAPKSWQAHRHSLTTRKKVMKFTRKNRMLGSDPLAGYFDYLIRNKELPKEATEIVRISREFGQIDVSITNPANKIAEDDVKPKIHGSEHTNTYANIPTWSPDIDKVPLKGN